MAQDDYRSIGNLMRFSFVLKANCKGEHMDETNATPYGLMKTVDGGRHWRIVCAQLLHVDQLDFLNARVGWALLHNGKVKKTTNGGQSWT